MRSKGNALPYRRLKSADGIEQFEDRHFEPQKDWLIPARVLNGYSMSRLLERKRFTQFQSTVSHPQILLSLLL